jgi:predicted DNA-binding ribbon-helix-helix protein
MSLKTGIRICTVLSVSIVRESMAMTRYFFDVVSRTRSQYDSRGTLLPNSEEAYKWARLLAVVLQVGSDKQELVGGEIRVRGPGGPELFSIPIGHLEAHLERVPRGRCELAEGDMKSFVVKRSMIIGGRNSSVSLEEAFWKGLKEIALNRRLTLSELVDNINAERRHSNLSSAIRLFVLDQYRTKIDAVCSARGPAEEKTRKPPTGEDTPGPTKPF